VSQVDPPRPPSPPALPPNSRYATVGIEEITEPDGTVVRYFRRRFIVAPDQLPLVRLHGVEPGERLDLVAGDELGDPELWWQVADANGAVRPAELVDRPGRQLRITLPEGIPGAGS
jgi:hypothetical protein